MMQPRCVRLPARPWWPAGACLGLALLVGAPIPASASSPSAAVPAFRSASPAPLAAGISSYLSGLATRERVIQVAAVGMCLALFILLKKFADEPSSGGRPRRSPPPSKTTRERTSS